MTELLVGLGDVMSRYSTYAKNFGGSWGHRSDAGLAGRGAPRKPSLRMFKLTEQREIMPYKRAHRDEER
jgi:hypothetical protein